MAIQYLTPIDLVQNELRNGRVHILSSAPSTPVTGQIYYNSTNNTFQYWNGTIWIDPLARANHSGTQLAATISDLLSTRLDQFAAPNTDLSLASHKLINVTDPTNPQDAATKAYADAMAAGLTDYKASVRVASATGVNVNTAVAPASIDGITLTTGDRVLLKDQTTSAQNGIYVFNGVGAAMARSTDADSNAEFTSGMYVFVSEGTTQADSGWVLATNDPINLGVTTPITFVQFSGAGQLTAGNGITKTGNTIAVNIDASMFQFGSGGNLGQLQLLPSYQTRKFAAACTANAQQSINHALNTRDVNVTVYRSTTPWDVVYCDVEMLDLNNVQVRFATAPTTGQYRVVVVG